MGYGVSIFLITLGAILKFAITAHISGVDLRTLGVILMIVGGASLLLQIVLLNRRPKEPLSESDNLPYRNGEHNPPPV